MKIKMETKMTINERKNGMAHLHSGSKRTNG